MKCSGIMIMERVIVKRPVILKKMSFEEAKKIILDEAIKTENVEIIGAISMLLREIERRRDG